MGWNVLSGVLLASQLVQRAFGYGTTISIAVNYCPATYTTSINSATGTTSSTSPASSTGPGEPFSLSYLFSPNLPRRYIAADGNSTEDPRAAATFTITPSGQLTTGGDYVSTNGDEDRQLFAVSPELAVISTKFSIRLNGTLNWENDGFGGGEAIFCFSGDLFVIFDGILPTGCARTYLSVTPTVEPGTTSTYATSQNSRSFTSSVYTWSTVTANSPTATPSYPPGTIYGNVVDAIPAGCLSSSPEDPAIFGPNTFIATLEQCGDWCEDYNFFGVQAGSFCVCGNSISRDEQGTCDTPCPGNPTAICGGADAVAAYQIVFRRAIQPPTSTTIPVLLSSTSALMHSTTHGGTTSTASVLSMSASSAGPSSHIASSSTSATTTSSDFPAPTSTGTPNCAHDSPFDGTVNSDYLIMCDTELTGSDLDSVPAANIAECIEACNSYIPTAEGQCVAIAFDIVAPANPCHLKFDIGIVTRGGNPFFQAAILVNQPNAPDIVFSEDPGFFSTTTSSTHTTTTTAPFLSTMTTTDASTFTSALTVSTLSTSAVPTAWSTGHSTGSLPSATSSPVIVYSTLLQSTPSASTTFAHTSTGVSVTVAGSNTVHSTTSFQSSAGHSTTGPQSNIGPSPSSDQLTSQVPESSSTGQHNPTSSQTLSTVGIETSTTTAVRLVSSFTSPVEGSSTEATSSAASSLSLSLATTITTVASSNTPGTSETPAVATTSISDPHTSFTTPGISTTISTTLGITSLTLPTTTTSITTSSSSSSSSFATYCSGATPTAALCPNYNHQALNVNGDGVCFEIECQTTLDGDLLSGNSTRATSHDNCISFCTLYNVAIPFGCVGVNYYDTVMIGNNCVLLSSITGTRYLAGVDSGRLLYPGYPSVTNPNYDTISISTTSSTAVPTQFSTIATSMSTPTNCPVAPTSTPACPGDSPVCYSYNTWGTPNNFEVECATTFTGAALQPLLAFNLDDCIAWCQYAMVYSSSSCVGVTFLEGNVSQGGNNNCFRYSSLTCATRGNATFNSARVLNSAYPQMTDYNDPNFICGAQASSSTTRSSSTTTIVGGSGTNSPVTSAATTTAPSPLGSTTTIRTSTTTIDLSQATSTEYPLAYPQDPVCERNLISKFEGGQALVNPIPGRLYDIECAADYNNPGNNPFGVTTQTTYNGCLNQCDLAAIVTLSSTACVAFSWDSRSGICTLFARVSNGRQDTTNMTNTLGVHSGRYLYNSGGFPDGPNLQLYLERPIPFPTGQNVIGANLPAYPGGTNTYFNGWSAGSHTTPLDLSEYGIQWDIFGQNSSKLFVSANFWLTTTQLTLDSAAQNIWSEGGRNNDTAPTAFPAANLPSFTIAPFWTQGFILMASQQGIYYQVDTISPGRYGISIEWYFSHFQNDNAVQHAIMTYDTATPGLWTTYFFIAGDMNIDQGRRQTVGGQGSGSSFNFCLGVANCITPGGKLTMATDGLYGQSGISEYRANYFNPILVSVGTWTWSNRPV